MSSSVGRGRRRLAASGSGGSSQSAGVFQPRATHLTTFVCRSRIALLLLLLLLLLFGRFGSQAQGLLRRRHRRHLGFHGIFLTVFPIASALCWFAFRGGVLEEIRRASARGLNRVRTPLGIRLLRMLLLLGTFRHRGQTGLR